MTYELKAGDRFTWTHPEHGEVYYFVAKEVELFGSVYTITLSDGSKLDAWCYEINAPENIEIDDSQINPDTSDEPVRHGRLMV